MVHHVGDAVAQHRHPVDARLGQADAQAREAHGHARPQPVGAGHQRVHREQRGQQLERRARASATPTSPTTRSAGTPPCPSPRTRRGTGPSGRCASTADPCRPGSRGSSPPGNLAPRCARTLVRRDLRIGQPRHLQRDEPVGARARPTPRCASRSTPARRPGRARDRSSGRRWCRRTRRSGSGSAPTPTRRRCPCRPRGPRGPSSPGACRRSWPAPSTTRPWAGRPPR